MATTPSIRQTYMSALSWRIWSKSTAGTAVPPAKGGVGVDIRFDLARGRDDVLEHAASKRVEAFQEMSRILPGGSPALRVHHVAYAAELTCFPFCPAKRQTTSR